MATLGTCVVTHSFPSNKMQVITFTCVGSVDAATIPSTSSGRVYGTLLFVDTVPGATNPTASYDIVFNNSDGLDIMGGALANRSATLPQRAVPMNDSIPYILFVNGSFTMVITGQEVNSANIIVRVFVERNK